MTKLDELANIGQSVWLDYISRSLILSGELQNLIELGLRGVTSNPTIFDKAISASEAYDPQIRQLALQGLNTQEIYTQLTVADIQNTADLFLPVYEKSFLLDGYVSLEVNPNLANDTTGTLSEAIRLWELVNRPNLMIKIPATPAGLPAIREAIFHGINVNVTLIFSVQRYLEVLEAYCQGIEERTKAGLPVHQVASVASFFVSRLDTKVDQRLSDLFERSSPESTAIKSLFGKAAIANTKIAYQEFTHFAQSSRFKSLQNQGAQIQRPLWASTSTKNPSYSDILYVQELIGPQTVNTMPLETMQAFMDHGTPQVTILDHVEEAYQLMEDLHELGIDMSEITTELENEGVASFVASFTSLLKSIEEKRHAYLASNHSS